LSEGPYFYLIASDGEKLALFDMPDASDAVPSADGFVGETFDEGDDEEEEEIEVDEPEPSTVTYPKVADVVDSEFEDDEDDDEEWTED
jgi:hypothetical protein